MLTYPSEYWDICLSGTSDRVTSLILKGKTMYARKAQTKLHPSIIVVTSPAGCKYVDGFNGRSLGGERSARIISDMRWRRDSEAPAPKAQRVPSNWV